MSVTQHEALVQRFSQRFAEELEFYVMQNDTGELTGQQISDCAMDVIQIDLRQGRADAGRVIGELPVELKNLIVHASNNPRTIWPGRRQIMMVKAIGGITT